MFPAESTRVILFMLATAAQTVVGLYLCGYAAHCFLVVVEETGAGNDAVQWPDVPILDWLWKIIYLVWLVAFWAVPSWLVLGVLLPELIHGSGLPFLYILVGAVWLVFPISLFSSLSANSRWMVFRAEVLRRLAYHGRSMLVVYLVSGVLVIGWAALAYVTLTKMLWLLPVMALLGPAVLLIDARLLGRMAWLLNHRTPERRRAAKPKKIPPRERAIEVDDPWAVPPEMLSQAARKKPLAALDDPNEGEFEEVQEADDADFLPVTGYGLAKEEPPPPPPASLHLGEHEPLGVQANPDNSGKAVRGEPVLHPGLEVGKFSRYEAELAAGSPEPTPPARPLLTGVYQFPWYPQTASAWVILAILTLMAGALAKVQVETWFL